MVDLLAALQNPDRKGGDDVGLVLVDIDANLLTILLHGVPVFGDGGLGLDELLPGDRRAARRDFHHFNAALHRADVEA